MTLLLAAEITWLLGTLKVIDLPFLGRKSQKGLVEAGHVVKMRQDLKRRARSSLVWESSRESDTLYYHDSILTLSQSEANLYLKDKTELHLAENTLVSLEPTDGKSNSEIRLRFSKGDIRARNPARATELKDDDWTVTLEKGSDVSVRKQNGQVEFDVHQGKAILNNQNGVQVLGVDDVLRMQDGKIEKLSKNPNLKWKDTPNRSYTLTPIGAVPVQWVGKAKRIQVQKVGEPTETVTLADEEQSKILPLPPGSYTLRLEDETGMSEATRIEVWSAPRIVLRKPLPRDRLLTMTDNEFVWSLLPEVKEYRLRLFRAGAPDNLFSSKVNFFNVRYNEEADLTWAVEGLDGDGHVIPSPYDNPLYFRHEPFQAPKLKTPLLRHPAKQKEDGAFWFRLLIPEAHAQQSHDLEAVFQWESVEGADQYVIEICAEPDFRKTEIMKTVKKPEFVWRKFDLRKYYWRVAAGHSGGRMGVFTQPVELDFTALKPGETGDINGVTVKKVEASKQAPAPKLVEAVVKKPEPIAITEPPPLVREPEKPRRPMMNRFGFTWAPSYRLTNLTGQESTNLKLAGMSPDSWRVDMEKPLNDIDYWFFDFWRSEQTWKPEPVGEYPFQSNLNIPETWIRFEKGTSQSPYRHGLSIHQTFAPRRLETEAIVNKEYWLFGYRGTFAYETPWTDQPSERVSSSLIGFSLSTAGQIHELAVDFSYKKYLFWKTDERSFYLGAQVTGIMQAGQSQGSLISGFLFLGFDWFRQPSQAQPQSEGQK